MARAASGGIGLALALCGLLLLFSQGGGAVQPSKPKPRKNLERSLDKLVPAFRAKVVLLLELMRADGFDPFVWETWRSPERALELHEKGTGALLSQHSLGLAVDIVDRKLLWNAPPAFWAALERHALALGLGRVKRRDAEGNLVEDPPHVQALPGKYDAKMRALATAEKREAHLAKVYA